jgi:hypothetical protein
MRLVVDSHFCGYESTATLQQRQPVISLQSMRGHFRPDPRSPQKQSRTEENSKGEFNRTVRSSRVKDQFKGRLSSSSKKAVRVGPVVASGIQRTASAKQKLLKKPICSSLLAGVLEPTSLAIWLDQEEELVQLVPDGTQRTTSAKLKLSKRLIQAKCQCCRRNMFQVTVICCSL